VAFKAVRALPPALHFATVGACSMGLNSLHNFTPEDSIFVYVLQCHPYPLLDSLRVYSAHVMMGFSLPGTCLSVIVLAAFAVVAWNPVSRPYLDRVSFRLLTYAIIAK
jgi:hypothetical protein